MHKYEASILLSNDDIASTGNMDNLQNLCLRCTIPQINIDGDYRDWDQKETFTSYLYVDGK